MGGALSSPRTGIDSLFYLVIPVRGAYKLDMSHIRQTRDQAADTWLIGISSILGISACAGDLIMTHLLGTWYPGYRPLFQPMSDLGDVGSPVASIASTCWVTMGLLFIVFGYGFYKAFSHHGKQARKAACMLALYGIGEGLGSGLAPRTPGKPFLVPASIVHSLFGVAGVAAAVLLPFVIMRFWNPRPSHYLYWYSWFTTITGVLFLALFSVAFVFRPEGGWISYAGLWQRLFMLTYYLFFICLAVLMLIRCEPASPRWSSEATERN